MKNIVILSAILACTGAAASAEDVSNSSPGYEALMAGNNELAIKQILATGKISPSDPASMINLGRAYVRTGRTTEASQLFRNAMQSPSRDIELADGTATTTRQAAKLSLRQIESRIAAR